MPTLLGIDIGGTGMKAAPVDTNTGDLIAPRHRILTPHPAVPNSMARVFAELTTHFDWTGRVGATFPAVVKAGVARTAANIDRSWIGTDVAATFARSSHCDVTVVNDADAAGVAEARFGAGRAHRGLVVMVTIGTGVGTELINDGALIPNTGRGHICVDGHLVDTWLSDATRVAESIPWKRWTRRSRSRSRNCGISSKLNRTRAVVRASWGFSSFSAGMRLMSRSSCHTTLTRTTHSSSSAVMCHKAGKSRPSTMNKFSWYTPAP